MTVKIGINPITWTNDDMPELGGDTPLEVCLSETAQAGYRGTELGGKFPRNSRALAAVLARHGLELVSGWYDGRILDRSVDEEFAAALPHLSLLRAAGAAHVVYADTSRGRHGGIFQPISKRPKLQADEWGAYGAKITELAERMADFGVGMAFHHHMGTIVETDAEVGLLMRHSGKAVGLLFDTGHCLFSGGDPASLLDRHIDRVVHVHCKDVRPAILQKARSTDMSFMAAVLDGIFTVPGDGGVDFTALLTQLAQRGYCGWLVVEAEQDPKKANPLTYATMGYRNLERMAIDAGLTVLTGVPSRSATV
ncbi:myo-inosose-2 dehydratase [Verminephrobacter eiseniae]|uniref:Xylose isomerase domain protein TIM barrel n=1 Tax=Verminephrobacter eiseniae (strain EF01-2) TaxID=391735 RepID=A1WDX9_VEREI|nr:myo-inosose-2 dehydratase [Verminephrobacter eiseniae]ABM55836.1 Xylose isomerase domain protein TIM barrel [Verminephrobacter eiseniae EF01-2]MCW5286217.1 myo-inosose-2 dehydratase [Verminephrobacter eiseniae]MCW5304516.1 myo-inosose-2 dehydratase [Verminephrobacter eiseniae]MCW8181532.1 myo-inosose-2 dehydratase [Verminephrobacter eiseniae]MCW8190856.1 myo-inosose-2 dehydratase [Verminephrobacter eiseniae]